MNTLTLVVHFLATEWDKPAVFAFVKDIVESKLTKTDIDKMRALPVQGYIYGDCTTQVGIVAAKDNAKRNYTERDWYADACGRGQQILTVLLPETESVIKIGDLKRELQEISQGGLQVVTDIQIHQKAGKTSVFDPQTKKEVISEGNPIPTFKAQPQKAFGTARSRSRSKSRSRSRSGSKGRGPSRSRSRSRSGGRRQREGRQSNSSDSRSDSRERGRPGRERGNQSAKRCFRC
jgi:hypothetical protein